MLVYVRNFSIPMNLVTFTMPRTMVSNLVCLVINALPAPCRIQGAWLTCCNRILSTHHLEDQVNGTADIDVNEINRCIGVDQLGTS